MTYSIQEMKRPVRRRLKRIVHKQSDANYRRRANALLLLWEGHGKSEVARLLQAARSTLDDWVRRYEAYGEAGLVPEPPGAPETTVTEALCRRLIELIQHAPATSGFHRSRWTSEMLARQMARDPGVVIHASTVRWLLPKLQIVWNRARPTLCIKDPQKARKIRAIRRALDQADTTQPVFMSMKRMLISIPGSGLPGCSREHKRPSPRQAKTRNVISPGPCTVQPARSSGWKRKRKTRSCLSGCWRR